MMHETGNCNYRGKGKTKNVLKHYYWTYKNLCITAEVSIFGVEILTIKFQIEINKNFYRAFNLKSALIS